MELIKYIKKIIRDKEMLNRIDGRVVKKEKTIIKYRRKQIRQLRCYIEELEYKEGIQS